MSVQAKNQSKRKLNGALETDEYFGVQKVSEAELGDPRPVLAFLAQAVIETLAGVRDVEQSARWLSDSVYQQLKQRALAANRARAEQHIKLMRPNLVVGKMTTFSPRQGVLEAVVIVHNQGRARAVAIRLEGYNGRWRAKSLAIL